MIIAQKIKLDLDQQPDPNLTIYAVQGETARAAVFQFFYNGAEWMVPEGTMVSIRHSIQQDGILYSSTYDTLSDGSPAYSIDGSTVTVHLTPEVLSIWGLGNLQIGLFNNGKLIITFSVGLHVQMNASLEGITQEVRNDLTQQIHTEVESLRDIMSDAGFGNAYYVNVCCNDNAYIADKTFAEIYAAYSKGSAICCVISGAWVASLHSVSSGRIVFQAVIDRTYFRVVINSDNSVTCTSDDYALLSEMPATVPQYVQTEAERVAQNILSVRTGQSFSFAAFSDAHMAYSESSAVSTEHAGAGLKHIRQITNLDMVAHLGDYINGGPDSTRAGSKEEYRAYHKAMAEGCMGIPTVWISGNHDANYQGGDVLTLDELYAHIGSNNQGDHVVQYGNESGLYGYLDFPAKRLRVIYLNTSDGWKTGVSDQQVAWLISTAFDFSDKTDAASWGIIILMHIPVTFGDNASLLSAINAYTATSSAELIAIFHGHCHNFRTEQVGDARIWQIGIPELCVGRNNEYGTAGQDDDYGSIFGEFDADGNAVFYPKTSGTAEDTSFNVVTIDRTNKSIYCHVFGAGYVRVLSYAGADAPVTYAITNKLTNVTSDNAATTIEENSSYKATLTVADGCALESVVVSMGGMDITASSYADGVVSIAAVNGNLIISATAAMEESGGDNTGNDTTVP